MAGRGTIRVAARRRRAAVAVAAGACLVGLAACSGATAEEHSAAPREQAGQVADKPAPAKLDLALNVKKSAVPVDSHVTLRTATGSLDDVKVFYRGEGSRLSRLPGSLDDDQTAWSADALLEPGERYSVVARGTTSDGSTVTKRQSFRTEDLSLDQQTYPSFSPLQGQTVGVGMPVIVKFDVPVTNRAAIERHLSVDATPAVTGSWHWVSDYEVHYRPKNFWASGTDVTVSADINGVNAGNGIYGQMDRTMSFTIGDSVITKTDLDTDQMKVFVNSDLVRTLPVTGGKPGYDTRSGTKLIVEKFESKRMDAATTGISKDDPEYYNLSDVEYAMRVTYTGEFIHAAPWSVADQGVSNVSHGCVGLSTEDAQWLFGISHIGDVVKVTGSDRGIEPNNGWTDWDVSFADYRQGSALH